MPTEFEFASGSITGRDHLQPLKWGSGQDAYYFQTVHQCHIGIVSDGCGSGSHSEVGSKLIVRLVSESLSRVLPKYLARSSAAVAGASVINLGESFPYWKEVQDDIVANLRVLARAMGADLNEVVSDYFLATIFGFLITPFTTFVFSIGDGCYAVNEEFHGIDSGIGNDPDYISYHMLRRQNLKKGVGDCNFIIRAALPTCEVESLLIATDGALKWDNLASKNLPGKEPLVGPISQFWTDDVYFTNADQLRRKLALMNFESVRVDWENQHIKRESGLLADDTTIISVRRKPTKEETT